MTAMLLTMLFASTGAFALSSIAVTIMRCGKQIAALRDNLRELGDFRDVDVRVSEVKLRMSGIILAPDFTKAGRLAGVKHGFRAAA